MTSLSVFTLYPAWSVALLVALVSLRLGRSAGLGLPLLCFTQGVWLTGLILFATPGTASIAERVLPVGIVEAAGFVHAIEDLSGKPRRGLVVFAWAVSLLVALVGALDPRLYYGAGARGPGPLFVPLAIVCTLGTLAVFVGVVQRVRTSAPPLRGRFLALALGLVCGAAGGSATIGLFVLGRGSVLLAAPLMLASTLLAAYATLGREQGRTRALVETGLVYALITAVVSAVFATAYALALPYLVPSQRTFAAFVAAAVAISFFAALPLDPLRALVVDSIGRRVSRSPIGVRDLATAIDASETRADHAERLAELGTIVSAVAHEIRNPLGVMLAQAKLLEKSGADPEAVAALRAEVARARRFVDDLLRFGKPRPLSLAPVALREAVARAASRAARAVGADEARLEIDGDAELTIDVDEAALGDIVVALVENALIAGAPPEPQLGAEGDPVAAASRVTIAVRRIGDRARVEVEDDGPGVPREIEPRLFAPFVTGRGRDASHPGTGLGLATAARWAARHGGSLTHARPERGARFVIDLPVRARVTTEDA